MACLFLFSGLLQCNYAVENNLAAILFAACLLVDAEVTKTLELEPLVGLDVLQLVPNTRLMVGHSRFLIKVFQPVFAFLL